MNMQMYTCKLFTAVSLVFMSVSGASAANLVTNGGFETGDLTGWTIGTLSFAPTVVTNFVDAGSFAAQIAGFSFLPNTIGQTIATTPGTAYVLSFARLQNLAGPTILLDVTWNGVSVFSELNPSTPGYQTFTAGVVGTGSDALVFESANDNNFTFLDSVSVNGVPEPASWAMLIAGFGMTGAALRRRRVTVAA